VVRGPDLVYHYVTVHDYRPPDEFILAVVHGREFVEPAIGD